MGRTSREAHKIIVVGLPTASTTEDLLKLVRPFGNPLEAAHAVDAEGKPRGFAFVRFADSDAQQAAIAGLNQTDLQGRTLNVRAVEERGNKEPAGSSKGRPCFDFAKGKCARGTSCKWAHVKPDQSSGTSRRPDWQKTRPDAASVPPSELFATEIPEDYCRKYQLGKCHRGAACRWKHEIWKLATKSEPQATSSKSTPPDYRSGADDFHERKKARVAWSDSTVERDAGPRAGSDPKRVEGQDIGVSSRQTPEAMRAELEAAIASKEEAWREAHPDADVNEPVPTEVKRRDVVWRALERMLQRAFPEMSS